MNKMDELRVTAEQAKAMYAMGIITREEAKERIQPFLDSVNTKMVEVAKKHGKKAKLISFSGYCR